MLPLVSLFYSLPGFPVFRVFRFAGFSVLGLGLWCRFFRVVILVCYYSWRWLLGWIGGLSSWFFGLGVWRLLVVVAGIWRFGLLSWWLIVFLGFPILCGLV